MSQVPPYPNFVNCRLDTAAAGWAGYWEWSQSNAVPAVPLLGAYAADANNQPKLDHGLGADQLANHRVTNVVVTSDGADGDADEPATSAAMACVPAPDGYTTVMPDVIGLEVGCATVVLESTIGPIRPAAITSSAQPGDSPRELPVYSAVVSVLPAAGTPIPASTQPLEVHIVYNPGRR